MVVVEDDEELMAAMAEFFVDEGHEVRQASNVPQALSLLSSFAPELVLIDIGLPVFDGNYLAAAIHRHGNHRPRLIAITGRQDRVHGELFDAVLRKPFIGPDVMRVIAQQP